MVCSNTLFLDPLSLETSMRGKRIGVYFSIAFCLANSESNSYSSTIFSILLYITRHGLLLNSPKQELSHNSWICAWCLCIHWTDRKVCLEIILGFVFVFFRAFKDMWIFLLLFCSIIVLLGFLFQDDTFWA